MLILVTVILGSYLAQKTFKPAVKKAKASSEMIEVVLLQPAKPKAEKIINMKVTAYCPCKKCCGKYADGITASGYKIQSGDKFLAADKRYPFGTKMIVPGYADNKPVKVLDRGGAIKGNRLDVFFPTHQEALNWGVKNLPVKIFN